MTKFALYSLFHQSVLVCFTSLSRYGLFHESVIVVDFMARIAVPGIQSRDLSLHYAVTTRMIKDGSAGSPYDFTTVCRIQPTTMSVADWLDLFTSR